MGKPPFESSVRLGQIGMPNAYDCGSQRGAWATHSLTNYAGDDGWAAECYPFYRGMFFVGDTLRIKGEITGKWVGKSGIGYPATGVALCAASASHGE